MPPKKRKTWCIEFDPASTHSPPKKKKSEDTKRIWLLANLDAWHGRGFYEKILVNRISKQNYLIHDLWEIVAQYCAFNMSELALIIKETIEDYGSVNDPRALKMLDALKEQWKRNEPKLFPFSFRVTFTEAESNHYSSQAESNHYRDFLQFLQACELKNTEGCFLTNPERVFFALHAYAECYLRDRTGISLASRSRMIQRLGWMMDWDTVIQQAIDNGHVVPLPHSLSKNHSA